MLMNTCNTKIPQNSSASSTEPPIRGAQNGEADENRYSTPAAEYVRGTIRTFVVDESPMILKALSIFLQKQGGFELVGAAAAGDHAVCRVAELRPDLLLLELSLSGMSGSEVIRQIKARAPAPVVILLTAGETLECLAAARAAGADAFVDKRRLFAQLLPTIRALFSGDGSHRN